MVFTSTDFDMHQAEVVEIADCQRPTECSNKQIKIESRNMFIYLNTLSKERQSIYLLLNSVIKIMVKSKYYIPSINFLLFCSEIVLVSMRSEIFH